MRRRRQGLKVETFPFLAVLLCAMGSLILLLLVMDRRAKAVAHAKAVEAALLARAERSKLSTEEQERQQQEWERRRQELHALLAEQDQELLVEIEAAAKKTSEAAGKVQMEEVNYAELWQQLKAEEVLLQRGQQDLAARRGQVAQAAGQKEAAKGDLLRLAAELLQLERTLTDLKLIKQKEGQTYSLVPYLGRRGDNRKPVYVECAHDGVLFHPDRLELRGPGGSSADIRAEVERRIARALAESVQAVAKTASMEAAAKQSLYLFFLVRPDGLESYYKMQSAMAGLDVDFGYEFIDNDWVLDFSPGGNPTEGTPWRVAGSGKNPPEPAVTAPAPPLARHIQTVPRGTLDGAQQGVAWGPASQPPGQAGAHVVGRPLAVAGGAGPFAQPGSGNGTSRPGGAASGPPGTATGLVGLRSGSGPGGGFGPYALLGGSGSGGGGTGGAGWGTGGGGPGAAAGATGSREGGGPGPGGGVGQGVAGQQPGGSPGAGSPGGGATGGGVTWGPATGGGVAGAWGQSGGGTGMGPRGIASGSGSGTGPAGFGSGGGPSQGSVGSQAGVPGTGGPGGPAGVPSPGGVAAVGGGAAGGPGQAGGGGVGSGQGPGGPGGGRGGPAGVPSPGGVAAVGGGAAGGSGQAGGGGTGPGQGPGGPAGGAGGPAGAMSPGGVAAVGGGAAGGPGQAGGGGAGSGQGPGGPGGGAAGGAPTGGLPQGLARLQPPLPGSASAGGAPGYAPGGGSQGAGPAGGQAGQPASPDAASPPSQQLPSLGLPGLPTLTPPPTPGQVVRAPRGLASGGSPPGGSGDGAGGPPDIMSALGPPGIPGKGPVRRPAAVPLSHVLGNRDWNILIECQAEKLIVHSTKQEFTTSALLRGGDGRVLVESVRQLVARRQATVRPGEPPYRPILRFRVHDDGLRCYYTAFSLLEGLRLPMARENVEEDATSIPNLSRN